jgi:hypothetical protein
MVCNFAYLCRLAPWTLILKQLFPSLVFRAPCQENAVDHTYRNRDCSCGECLRATKSAAAENAAVQMLLECQSHLGGKREGV